MRRSRFALGTAVVLLAVPVGCAVLGPLLAGRSPRGRRPVRHRRRAPAGHRRHGPRRPRPAAARRAERPGTACAAVALAYLVGATLGLTAAVTRHQWLEELLMRPWRSCCPSLPPGHQRHRGGVAG
ncbi:hypothetical protein NKH77_45975 [Streptomyces sp. M19]